MKIFIFLMFLCLMFSVQPADDHYSHCESCLTAAREIEKILKEAPAGSRKKVVANLTSGGLCEKLYKHDHIASDKMKATCRDLFDSHIDQFKAALLNQELQHVEIVLCYEQSSACVGVKRKSFSDNKATFTDADIDALLQENKENVRISRPAPLHGRDEM